MTEIDPDQTLAPLAAPTVEDRQATRIGLQAAGVLALFLVLVVALVLVTRSLGAARDDRDELADQAERRSEAMAAARSFAVALTSYDHTRIAQDVAAVTESTADSETCDLGSDGKPVEGAEGCFRSEYALAGGAAFQQLVKDNKAVSKGEVRSAGLVSDTEGQVVVLLAVDQTVTNASRPTPRVDRNRIQLTLELRGDRWLVVDVQVL